MCRNEVSNTKIKANGGVKVYGAVIGDIVGSPYEFSIGRDLKPKDFFIDGSVFTDDSVMTLAIGDALMKAGKSASTAKIKRYIIRSMQRYGKRYPDAGYGEKFSQWLKDRHCEPYNSCGNGSAMRVSAAGWLYDSIDRTREVARCTAEVSHNHPEGIKGAEAVVSVIYLARCGKSKNEIAEYVTREFGYNINKTVDSICANYIGNTTCQGTVPEAIVAFLKGESFEDIIRIAVSFGGDTDTLTAIAGSMAEAYYGIPDWIKNECDKRLDKKQLSVLKKFNAKKIIKR